MFGKLYVLFQIQDAYSYGESEQQEKERNGVHKQK